MSRNWRLDASLRENLKKKGFGPMRLLTPMKMTVLLITISFDRDYSRIGNIEPDTSINFTFYPETIGN